MRLPRSLILIAAILIVIGVGCMLFQDIQVPERVLVDNGELPALESADHLQTSLRFHPENPLIADLKRKRASTAGCGAFRCNRP